MTGIIRQLLDFARPRRSEKTTVDLALIVAQTTKLLESMAFKRGITLSMAVRAVRPRATVDEGQIQQALANLVVNAIHATSSTGEVTIGIDRETVQPPAEHGGPPATYLCLSVSDTGHGMDAETKARVFEPFFTTKGVGEGTGLGLSVTYGIVREHGGWLAIESAQGVGSTFSIYLASNETEDAA
jgi:signal transduction histidine kinase